MPLLEMSPNLQQAEIPRRKRSHDEFSSEDVKGSSDGTINPPNSVLPSPPGIIVNSPPENNSPTSMTDGGRSTPGRNSPTPNPTPTHAAFSSSTPAQSTTTTDATSPSAPNSTDSNQPPIKRKRLTFQEKAAKAEEEARKKKEREDQRLQKLAEKAKQDAEKQLAKEARAAEKAKREAAEQEAKAAKQQEREDKRRKKEEEERKLREEKERKARSQMRMTNFFKMGATTPKKAAAADTSGARSGDTARASPSPPAGVTPKKEEVSQYERMFHPFFVKEHVRMAPTSIPMDKETAEAKGRILDEYISGKRGSDVHVRPFNAVEALQLVSKPCRRGMIHPPVRSLMEDMQESSRAAGALEKLRSVPVKLLCFRQDVRPPYYGTLTCLPHRAGEAGLRRLARKPTARVLDLAYDYDSEAEWQDDEPGDDLDDMDDSEEDVDDEDDMDGFLDDSEDAGVARRIFANSMEPESTGICYEDGGVVDRLLPLKMEIILESLDRHSSIDPFSTQYWAPKKPPKAPKATMPPPPTPSNAFEAIGTKMNPSAAPGAPAPSATTGDGATATGAPAKPPVQIRMELLPQFKKALLANQKLSKMAIVEVLSIQMGSGVTKAEARAMLELVAEKRSVKGMGRVWVLKEGQ